MNFNELKKKLKWIEKIDWNSLRKWIEIDLKNRLNFKKMNLWIY